MWMLWLALGISIALALGFLIKKRKSKNTFHLWKKEAIPSKIECIASFL